jgi:hypothetical protein
VWVFSVLVAYGFVLRISADQNVRTERISGDFLLVAVFLINLSGILVRILQ